MSRYIFSQSSKVLQNFDSPQSRNIYTCKDAQGRNFLRTAYIINDHPNLRLKDYKSQFQDCINDYQLDCVAKILKLKIS